MGLSLRGQTSGAIDINAPNVAGDNTITLPGTNGAANQFYKNSGTAGIVTHSSMVEDSSGNIGVGGNVITDFNRLNIQGSSATVNVGLVLNDTNTSKIYGIQNGSSALKFFDYTASIERMRIDSSGNLGIANNNPSDFKSGAENLVVGSGSGAEGITIYSESNASGRICFADGSGTGDEERGVIQYAHDDNHMQFNTHATERMRIDNAGRLLLGTNTERTNVPGSNEGFLVEGSTNNSSQNRFTQHIYGENSTSGPYIGLGKHRGSSNGQTDLVSSGDELGGIYFQGADGTNFKQGASIVCYVDEPPGTNDMPGRLTFQTTLDGAASPTERMRLTSQGGLWTACRTSLQNFGTGVHYNGFTQNSGGQWVLGLVNKGNEGENGYGLLLNYDSTTPNGTSNEFILAKDTSGNRFSVRSNGGIANYQSNNVNLSDEREKKNIEALDSTWDCLKNWDLKKFHYNEDVDTDDKRYGVIAQQVEQYCPEVLTDWVKQTAEDAVLDEDGNVVTPAQEEILRKGVKEQQMIWMAIKSLQEAQTRIETLETQNADLLSRVTALEG